MTKVFYEFLLMKRANGYECDGGWCKTCPIKENQNEICFFALNFNGIANWRDERKKYIDKAIKLYVIQEILQ